MDERPPFPPHERPGLRTRQGGNAISVRQLPNQDAGWGTLRRPKRFELPLLTPHQLHSKLGYEAVPASEFWQFELRGRTRLQVNRISADRYSSCVGLALLDANNQRVAPLVQSASGRGDAVEVPAGTYKLVAALGMAVLVKDLIFELHATPIGGSLHSIAPVLGAGRGVMPGVARRLLVGEAPVLIAGQGRPLHHGAGGRIQLSGAATLQGGGQGRLGQGRGSLQGGALLQAIATGQLQALQLQPLQGEAMASAATSAGRVAVIHWLDEPHSNWRARRGLPGVVELNRAYVRPPADLASQQEQQQLLQALLS